MLIRQEKIIKGYLKPHPDNLIGLNITPSKSTIDSIPYLMKTDYETLIDEVIEQSDYIVINITEQDKSKRGTMATLRSKKELK